MPGAKASHYNDVELPGQAAALTGAAPATARVPAVSKSMAPNLKGLMMILEIIYEITLAQLQAKYLENQIKLNEP
jgi:hypothetical protein